MAIMKMNGINGKLMNINDEEENGNDGKWTNVNETAWTWININWNTENVRNGNEWTWMKMEDHGNMNGNKWT